MTRRLLATDRALLLVVVSVTLATSLSGCIGEIRDYYAFEPDEQYVNPGVFPGDYRRADQGGSSVLQPRRATIGDPELYRLASSTPHSVVSGQPEAPAESTVYITIAAWVPTNGSMSTFPVIVVASPSFETKNNSMLTSPGTHPTIGWLLRNYLPLGYAIAAVSIRGTGTSGGCMELLGPREVSDLNEAIRFLATQEWSNGNVAMLGANYEGAAAWAVAGSGNEFLKAIVPVSAWPDTFGLLFHNGTVKSNAALMHPSLWFGGVDKANNPPPRPSDVPEPGAPVPPGAWVPRPFSANGREQYQDRQNVLCDDAYEGFAAALYGSLAGERGVATSDFWSQRDFRDDVLANYDGSVFLIHGLQDWNVDPHNSVPFNDELKAAGIDVKEWYGQWGRNYFCWRMGTVWFDMPCSQRIDPVSMKEWYGQWRTAYPDSHCPQTTPVHETPPCRVDFAETLRHWLDYHLMGNQSVDRGPALQVQDNRGYWRNADAYPPTNATWQGFYLNGDGELSEDAGPETMVRVAPPLEYGPAMVGNPPRTVIEFKTDFFEEDVRISGSPQVHVTFQAEGPGGVLAAWLYDENAAGKVYAAPYSRDFDLYAPAVPPIIGHGQIDLRFYDGGNAVQPLVPGQRYTAKLELEPLDVLVPKGHRLTLWILQHPTPDHDAGSVPSPVDVVLGEASSFRIPTITVPWDTIFPVPRAQFPSPEYFDVGHVRKPDYAELASGPLGEEQQGADCFEEVWLLRVASAQPSAACRRWLEE